MFLSHDQVAALPFWMQLTLIVAYVAFIGSVLGLIAATAGR